MKAIVYTRYGGPEELQLRDVGKPFPKNHEVLVRVHAVSLNDWDFGLLKGDFVNRMMNGFFRPRRNILGSDIAGVVESAGIGVTRFKRGDKVYGDLSGRWGGFAEYCCAGEKALALMPEGMGYAEAAAIPQAAMLAVQGLIDEGRLQAHEKILINGAGGGVGMYGIQIAKLFGAEVTGVDSGTKLDFMRSLGFDHVMDYTKEDFTKSNQRYDLILDAKTNRPVSAYSKVLATGGRYVTVGGSMGSLLQALVLGKMMGRSDKKQFRIVALKPNKDLEYMNRLFMDGKVRSFMEGPFPLESYREAFRLFERSEHKGKVVIVLG